MGTGISIEQATFSYGNHQIFSNIGFELNSGNIFCLLGPNGCGKTTLLRCVSGIMPLDSGRTRINGIDLKTMSERQRAQQIGFVFQEHHVLFPYTVLETVLMGRAPHLGFFSTPSKRDVQIACDAIEMVGITDLSEKAYTQISGGERQLALIARALAQEPSILMLDEPTSHLDFGNQVLVLKTIVRLAAEKNLTVIMATHFPGHALLVSSRVGLMKDGTLSAIGKPGQVMTETQLNKLYGVNVKIITVELEGSPPVQSVIPLLSNS